VAIGRGTHPKHRACGRVGVQGVFSRCAAGQGGVRAARGVVAVRALVPALRAGSMDAARALAVGSAPPASGGGRLGRLLQRLPLPRAAAVGVDDAFRRPLRGVLTLVALLIGVSTLMAAVAFRTVAANAVTDKAALGINYDLRSTASAPSLTPG